MLQNYNTTDAHTAKLLISQVFDEESVKTNIKNYDKLIDLITNSQRVIIKFKKNIIMYHIQIFKYKKYKNS